MILNIEVERCCFAASYCSDLVVAGALLMNAACCFFFNLFINLAVCFFFLLFDLFSNPITF